MFGGLGIAAASLLLATVATAELPASEQPKHGPLGRMLYTIDELDMPRASAPLSRQCDFGRNDAEVVKKQYAGLSSTGKMRRQQFDGLTLLGTVDQLKTFKLVLGNRPPSGWRESARGCADILCALTRLFGDETAARRILLVAARNGYVISASQEFNNPKNGRKVEQLFSPAEIRAIERALAEVPETLNRLPTLQAFYRIADGYRRVDHSEETGAFASVRRPPLPFAKGEGEIVFYDRAFDDLKSAPLRDLGARKSILHEVCHHFDYKGLSGLSSQLSSRKKQWGWWQLGWEPAGSESWSARPGASFPSHYASTEIDEDFADSCAMYIVAPRQLKSLTPERYAFLKQNVFQGREYLGSEGGWPAVYEIVDAEQVCERSLRRCYRTLEVTDHGEYREVTRRFEGETTTATYYVTSEYLYESRCATKAFEQASSFVAERLESHPEYCANGGLEGIRHSLEEICWGRVVSGLHEHLRRM